MRYMATVGLCTRELHAIMLARNIDAFPNWKQMMRLFNS